MTKTLKHMEANHQEESFLNTLHTKLNSDSSNELIISAGSPSLVHVEKPRFRGGEIYSRLNYLVEKANNEVLLMGYKLDGGSDGEKDFVAALNALSQKAIRQGRKIRVRVLINSREGLAGRVRPNSPVKNVFQHGREFEGLDLQYAQHAHVALGSFHSKMIVVDNQSAMLMSCDLMNHDNYRDGISRWVDMASVIHGDVVQDMRSDFIHAWKSKNTKAVFGEKKVNFEVCHSSDNHHILGRTIKAPTMFLSKKANGYLYKRSHMSPYTIGVIEAIKQAKSSINIVTPNLNEQAVITAIAEANKRGVKVRIVLGKHKGDKAESLPFAGGTNQDGVKRLWKEINVKNNQFRDSLEVRWATSDDGEELVDLKHQNQVHARLVCVDDVVFVGSSVLDKQSVYHSRECDVVMQSNDVCNLYLDTIFNPMFDKAIEHKPAPTTTSLISIALIAGTITLGIAALIVLSAATLGIGAAAVAGIAASGSSAASAVGLTGLSTAAAYATGSGIVALGVGGASAGLTGLYRAGASFFSKRSEKIESTETEDGYLSEPLSGSIVSPKESASVPYSQSPILFQDI